MTAPTETKPRRILRCSTSGGASRAKLLPSGSGVNILPATSASVFVRATDDVSPVWPLAPPPPPSTPPPPLLEFSKFEDCVDSPAA